MKKMPRELSIACPECGATAGDPCHRIGTFALTCVGRYLDATKELTLTSEDAK